MWPRTLSRVVSNTDEIPFFEVFLLDPENDEKILDET